jgi:hypothetical protein
MKTTAILMGMVLSAALASAASASVITSPEGQFIAFPVVNAFGAGPETLTSNITWSSTNANIDNQGAVYGWNQGYDFLGNGYSSGVSLVGLNDSSDYWDVVDSMTFAFATPVQSAGAVLNWVPNGSPVTIAVYNSSDVLLDSLTLSADEANSVTPDSFYGFSESTADISSFVLTDGYVAAIGGLNVAGVPEPATWALMLTGFAGLGAAMRFGRRKAAIA